MKILFLTRRFYPDIGGVEKHVFEISKELIKRGHQITIITESPPSLRLRWVNNYQSRYQSDIYSINSKEPVKSIQTNNFEAKRLKVFRLNFGKNDWLKKFKIWIKLLKYANVVRGSDVVHCHDVFFWYFPFRFLFPSKKVFTTFHGYETKFPPTLKSKIVRKISEKLSYGNICVGDFIKKWYGTKPNFVTYGGVEKVQSSKFKVQSSKKRGTMKILLLGRLEEDSGVKIYLKALKNLARRGVPYNLVVCGDGGYRKLFERYGSVKGFVYNLDKYIDRADFVFASSYLSILEAIIRGKNVFSVFQNQLKKDYLKLSPLQKYIHISSNPLILVNQLLSVQNDPTGTCNILQDAQKWSRTQTWAKVTDLYLKLWRL